MKVQLLIIYCVPIEGEKRSADLTQIIIDKLGMPVQNAAEFQVVPLAWSVGHTGHGVGASRFGARIGIELLGYEPSDVLKMKFVTSKSLPWTPEPLRWLGVRLTQWAFIKADRNGGKRGL